MRIQRRAVLWAVLLLGGALSAQGCLMREDELMCEEAALHISECCGYSVDARCGYFSKWESGYRTYPVFSADTGRCVARASCQALRDAGVCDVPSWRLTETCTKRYQPQNLSSEVRAACSTLEVLSCSQ